MMRRKNFALFIAALLLFSLTVISTQAFCGPHHAFPNQVHASVNIGNPHHPEHPDHPDHPGHGHGAPVHFVPNSQSFWDFSKNWTTNYGPAYRDTAEVPSNFVECTGDYALCFESGPEPLPCRATEDGRFADCKCVVHHGPNFVLITAILNEEVYQKTIAKCGPDGSGCPNADDAPVCQAIQNGSLIPGDTL